MATNVIELDPHRPTGAIPVGHESVPPELRRLLERLQKRRRSESDRDRRKDAVDRRRVARGDASWLLRPMPDEDAASFERRPKLTPSLLGPTARQLSYLYRDGITRRVASEAELDTKPKTEEWEKRVWGFGDGQTCAMKRVDRLNRILGTVHVLALYTPKPGIARDVARWVAGGPVPEVDGDEWGIDLVLYTPERVTALENPLDNRFAELVALEVSCDNIPAASPGGQARRRRLLHIWTDDHFTMAIETDGVGGSLVLVPSSSDDGGEGMAHRHVHENPYERIPVYECRQDADEGEYWGHPLGGCDMLKNLRTIYEQFSQYIWTSMLARGQLVHKGEGEVKGGLSPVSIIHVGEGDDLVALKFGSDLPGQREAIVTSLETTAKDIGLPSRSWRLDDRAARSGISIHLDRQELHDDRAGRIEETTRWEFGVADIVAMVANHHHPEAALDATDLGVDFGTWGEGESVDQKRSRVDGELEVGTMSRVDAVLELHPNLSQEDALQRVRDAGLTQADGERLLDLLDRHRAGSLDREVALAMARLFIPWLDDDELEALFVEPEKPQMSASMARMAEQAAAPLPPELRENLDGEPPIGQDDARETGGDMPGAPADRAADESAANAAGA